MSLTGLLFLFVFLPISLTVYYIVDDRIKEYVLVIFSLLFYAFGSLDYFLLFTVLVFVTVCIGRFIDKYDDLRRRRVLLIIGVALNLSVLIYYKYTDFAISIWDKITLGDVAARGLLLPLGISFYAFKAISYLVDVHQRRVSLDDKLIHDVLYLSFFGQVVSGPLTRYSDMKRVGASFFSDGVYRFLIGFSKKILIANVLGNITSEVLSTPSENLSTSFMWLGSVCFSLQLFFDFAGYSDMAIGLSEMFGYRCAENFNYPYMTESVSKFWRRWHISLSEWFRDYVYIPMGGEQVCSRMADLY